MVEAEPVLRAAGSLLVPGASCLSCSGYRRLLAGAMCRHIPARSEASHGVSNKPPDSADLTK